MERGPHSLRRRQTFGAFSNACNDNGCKAKASYDDVFGGPPKYVFSSFPLRAEDYSEIFGRFRLSRASSIPSLNLPAVDESVVSFDVLDSHFDYSDVFDRCNALSFAVTYEELLKPSNRDESSDEAWTPAESEYLSEESDPSAYDALDEITFEEDCNISYCDAKKYDYSNQSDHQRSDMYVHNRMKDLSSLCLPSEFLFSENEKSYLLKVGETKLSGKVSDVSLTLSSSVQSPTRPPTLNSKEEKCSRMQTLDNLPPQVDVGVVVTSSLMASVDSEQLGSLSGNILEENKDYIGNNVKVTVLEENVCRSCDRPLCPVIKDVQAGNAFPVTSKQSNLDEYLMLYGRKKQAKLLSPRKSDKTNRGIWNESAEFYEFIAEDMHETSSEKSSQLVVNDNCTAERTWGSERTLHAINTVLQEFDHRETAIDSTSSISELEENAVANHKSYDILTYDETKFHEGGKFLTENNCSENLEAAKNASEHRPNERQLDMHLDHYKQEEHIVCAPISMVVKRNADHNIGQEKGEDAVVRIPYKCYMKGGGIIDDLGKRLREALTWVKDEESVNSGCVKTELETTMGKNINKEEVLVGTDGTRPAFSGREGGYELSKIEQGNRVSLVETAKCKEVEKKLVSVLTLEDIKKNSKGQERDEKPYQHREDNKTQNKKSFQKAPSLEETIGLEHINNPEGEDNVQADSSGPDALFRTEEGTNSCKPKLTCESCVYFDESELIGSVSDSGLLTIYTTVGCMVSDEKYKLKADGKSKVTGLAEVKLGIVENHCKENLNSSSLAQRVSEVGECDVIDESSETFEVNLNFDDVGNKYSYNSEIQPVHRHEKNKNSITDNHVDKERGTRTVGLTITQEVENTERTPLEKISTPSTGSKVMNDKHLSAGRDKECKQGGREFEMNKVDEERERERERKKDRMAVEIGTREAHKSEHFDPHDLHNAADEASQRPLLSTRVEGESAHRRKVRLERYQRTAERAANALAEKDMRDFLAQREQAERIRVAGCLDADVKRWSGGKEGNLRALLSTLQYILGPDSGWQPIPLTGVITTTAVKKAYRKATLCVHPDKLQQRGASIQQKYVCEKVFDLLKEAWTKFNSEGR